VKLYVLDSEHNRRLSLVGVLGAAVKTFSESRRCVVSVCEKRTGKTEKNSLSRQVVNAGDHVTHAFPAQQQQRQRQQQP